MAKGLEFVAVQAQANEEGPEGVLGVRGIEGAPARGSCARIQSLRAESEHELDPALHLAGVGGRSEPAEFQPRTLNTEDLDIPTFLRNRR